MTWKRSASSGASNAKLAALSSHPWMSTSGGASGSPQVRPHNSRPGTEIRNSRIVAHLPGALAGGRKAAGGIRCVVIIGHLGPALGMPEHEIGDRPDLPGVSLRQAM